MSLYDYFTGQQSWTNYVSNRDLANRFERAITTSQSAQTRALTVQVGSQERALREGLGSLQYEMGSALDDVKYEVQRVGEGIDRLGADFHILMGEVIWKLDIQQATLTSILDAIRAPLDTAAKELRLRAEDAYRNGWHEEALLDLLESEKKNYQDFVAHRCIANIYFYHLVDLEKARTYFKKAAKYSRPRDARQSAEAEFFAGIAAGLLQGYEGAARHMDEALGLNPDFSEAHYMRASFAALLKQPESACSHLEKAVEADFRYFYRSESDPVFQLVADAHKAVLSKLLIRERKRGELALEALAHTMKTMNAIQDTSGGGLSDAMAEFSQRTSLLQAECDSSNVLGYRKAAVEARALHVEVLQAGVRACDRAIAQHRSQIAEVKKRYEAQLAEPLLRIERLKQQGRAITQDKHYSAPGATTKVAGAFLLVFSIPAFCFGVYALVLSPEKGSAIPGAVFALLGGGFSLYVLMQMFNNPVQGIKDEISETKVRAEALDQQVRSAFANDADAVNQKIKVLDEAKKAWAKEAVSATCV